MKGSKSPSWVGAILLFAVVPALFAAAPPQNPSPLAAVLGTACAGSPTLASVFTAPIVPGLTPAAQPEACNLPCIAYGVCQSCGDGTAKPCRVVSCCGHTTTTCGACTANCVPPPD
jgi:hypothetical protein